MFPRVARAFGHILPVRQYKCPHHEDWFVESGAQRKLDVQVPDFPFCRIAQRAVLEEATVMKKAPHSGGVEGVR
jgi:hypothetical protein